MALNGAFLKSVINDVFLPPKLPGRSESGSHEQSFIQTVISALTLFANHVGDSDQEKVLSSIGSMTNLKESRNDFGAVQEDRLLSMLGRLGENGKMKPRLCEERS